MSSQLIDASPFSSLTLILYIIKSEKFLKLFCAELQSLCISQIERPHQIAVLHISSGIKTNTDHPGLLSGTPLRLLYQIPKVYMIILSSQPQNVQTDEFQESYWTEETEYKAIYYLISIQVLSRRRRKYYRVA